MVSCLFILQLIVSVCLKVSSFRSVSFTLSGLRSVFYS